MDTAGRASSDESPRQSSSASRTFSTLRSRLGKGRTSRTTSIDLKGTDSNPADDEESERPGSLDENNAARRQHRRNQSGQSQKEPTVRQGEKSITASQDPSSSQAQLPSPLPPKVNPKPLENPLTQQAPTIVRFFAVSCVVLLLVMKFLHWTIAFILALTLAYVLSQQLQVASSDANWDKEERQRQFVANEGQIETAEWLNSVLKGVWPLINQEYFVPFIDLLEDALMQQVPPIVHSCRVEDLSQGTIPLRIQSFLVLDSSPEAFTRGTTSEPTMVGDDDEPKLDSGDFVNIEVTFAYRSPAARRKKTKTNKGQTVTDGSNGTKEPEEGESDLPVDQIHMLIFMAIGLQKIAAIEVPVWAEVLGLEGKMRLRLQLVPVLPFVGQVAFCFVGLPKIEMSAKPLGKRMVIDAMHLPLISSYVLHSVEAVIKDFIAPKAYTVDVASLLGSADGPSHVYSLGALVVVVHQAIDLPAADANGFCDPFVSIAFARAGKTLFTTRIIVKSRNAIWQELAVLLVSKDEVRDHEQLRLTVYDADKYSSDDAIGKVDVSIDRLINQALESEAQPGQATLLRSHLDDLQPMRKGADPPGGKLKYSVGFFRLARPTKGGRNLTNQAMLQKAASRQAGAVEKLKEAEETKEEPLPPRDGDTDEATKKEEEESALMELATPFDRFVSSMGFKLDPVVMRRRKERRERVDRLISSINGQSEATLGPPTKKTFPSGILAFHLHALDGLGYEGTQKSLSNSKRLAQKPQYTADQDSLGDTTHKMPNSYVQVILNDEAIFRTRLKTMNSKPFINAGSERFVLDFNTARIDFVVRDQRLREGDPILGIAGLNLSDVLVESSRSTQWYTLTGGLGWGKIKITLLWRSLEVNIPRELTGWNVGVIEVAKVFVSGIAKSGFERKSAHMLFETVGGRTETESTEPFDEYESGEGKEATINFQWSLKDPVRIPVRQRYPNFLYCHLRSDSKVPGRVHKHAHGVVSLARLIDGKEVHKRVPLFETNDWQRFEQDILRGVTTIDERLFHSTDGKDAQMGMRHEPVLEQICTQHEYTDLPSGIGEDGHIRKIGELDLTLIFHPGISNEHKSILGGDHEMRIAFESFQTLVDAGERPRPKQISQSRRRKLSSTAKTSPVNVLAKDGEGSSGQLSSPTQSKFSMTEVRKSRDGDRDGEEDDMTALRRPSSFAPSSEGTDRYGTEGEDGDGEEGNLVDEDTPEGRRARARALHRQHRGAAQVKGFRTLEWIKTNVEDGIGHVKRNAQQQRNKRMAKMESEGVSHF